MSRWTAEQVLALAPDSASISAGRKLAASRNWPSHGCAERVVWGLAQGSGKTPYQVAVDLDGPAYKCSCPSRKIPCKHALGLLLMWSEGEVGPAEPSPFATEWLASREERAEKAAKREAERPSRAPDPEAKAKRGADREARISAGVAELDRWLRDLVRQGFAAAQSRPMGFWDDAAARLVDAQAPGLARRVRSLGSTVHSGRPDWPARLLLQLGRLHLAVRAWQQREALPEGLRMSLRDVVGWTAPTEEVRKTGEQVSDAWTVLGVRLREQDHLRVRRTWLRGETTGRSALILEFTPPSGSFERDYVLGSVLGGELAFYPTAVPLRAVAVSELDGRAGTPAPGGDGFTAALESWSAALAADPWLERWPVTLASAVPVRSGNRWWLRDEHGSLAPLAGRDPWALVSLAGGTPLAVTGEWNGSAFLPLAAFAEDERVVAVS